MIKVFKTNVNHSVDSDYILEKVLIQKYPDFKINFDLEDCDNILRIEGSDFSTNDVVVLLDSCGFLCEELE